MIRWSALSVVLLAGLGFTRADEPRLTQGVLDDYVKLLEWRLGPDTAREHGIARLRQLVVNDWNNGDAKRRREMLSAVAWWRDDFPNLKPAERDGIAHRTATPAPDVERDRQADREQAIHRMMLQQQYDARQRDIVAISNVRASGHEVIMRIIDNVGPTRRYYDR
jgi:hypothetical protein